MVRAWVESRYRVFRRIVAGVCRANSRGARSRGGEAGHEGNAIVFTSATPIGICAARTLELEDARAMWLAGVLLNASFSARCVSAGMKFGCSV